MTSGKRLALSIHRYVGLVMAVFLITAGLTGTVLAFHREIDAALNPDLMQVSRPPGVERLEAFELQRRVLPQLPEGHAPRTVTFEPEHGDVVRFWSEGPDERWLEVFVDPYRGAVLGSRDWDDYSAGTRSLIPFMYRLHYSLALGEVGTFLFGIVALLWTVDCFVGAYLTFPAPCRTPAPRQGAVRRWLRRWVPAWLVRGTTRFGLVFTWHRASGLWVWAMLFVFAWSAVGLNLRPVYRPVMAVMTGMTPSVHDALPRLDPPHPPPRLSLQEAHAFGRTHVAEQAEARGFSIERELWLTYAADHGVFIYCVESSLDLSRTSPRTEVYFDGTDGHFVGFDAPTGIRAGNTISNWLMALHFGAVGGLPYRLFVAVMGLVVAALSVTGVWIWWRKRSKRSLGGRMSRVTPSRLRRWPRRVVNRTTM